MRQPGEDEPKSPSKRSSGQSNIWMLYIWTAIVVVATVATLYWRQPARVTTDPASSPSPTREFARLETERQERKHREEAAIEWLRNVQSFRDCDACPEMVVIPAASFVIGSPKPDNLDDKTNESPPRSVSVQSFMVARHQVSMDEWALCVKDDGCTYRPDPGKPPYPAAGEGAQPVTGVSWNDAQDYARWLGRQTGKNYRLPTEAEWESAARVGITAPVGWFHDKDFDPNKTKGNAWEWVQDCYVNSYADLPADGSALERRDCASRVLRGGWWTKNPDFYGRWKRRGWEESARDRVNGFRVARAP